MRLEQLYSRFYTAKSWKIRKSLKNSKEKETYQDKIWVQSSTDEVMKMKKLKHKRVGGRHKNAPSQMVETDSDFPIGWNAERAKFKVMGKERTAKW